MLGFLRRHVNKDFDINYRKPLYLALICPTVGYATQVWAPSLVCDIKSKESLQRRSTRFVMFDSEYNYRERLVKLNLLPVSYWLEINDLTLFYKCYSGYYNFPITDCVKPKPITRSTRNSCKLDMSVPFCRTKLFQNSYFNRIPKLWNNLPPCTRSSSSVQIFKTALYKHHLIALSNSFCPDTYNTWRTICPKWSACNELVSPPTCCY